MDFWVVDFFSISGAHACLIGYCVLCLMIAISFLIDTP